MLKRRKVTPRKVLRWLATKRPSGPWPHADGIERLDRPFLILLTPPNSGSSAIANFLGQAPEIMGLGWPEFGAGRVYEGQWLVPGLADLDRWWPEKYVNWASVAGSWAHRLAEKERRGRADFVLEKSPPNIVRYKGLRKILPNARFVVNNREPFANIASQIKRYGSNLYAGAPRDEAIAHLAEVWLYRSRHLRAAHLEEDFPLVSYEDFCADPASIVRAFELEGKIGFRSDFEVQVKDYDRGGIENMNASQVAQLTDSEITLISGILSQDPELVRFFGYTTNI